MENKNKEIIAISAGLVLIMAVLGLTVFRSFIFPKKEIESPIQEQKASYKMIYPKNLQQKIRAGEEFQFIDIRPFEDYSKEHVVDSMNIPADSIVSSLEKIGKKLVLITDSLEHEFLEQASVNLIKKGSETPLVLYGGIAEWRNIGNPTVTYGDPELFEDQSKVSYISQEDFKKKIASGEDLIAIDVRSKEDFNKGHLPFAINIPLYEIENRRNEIRSSKSIILYSNIEIEAFQAAVKLYDIDFTTSSVLIGGFSQWSKDGNQIQK